MLYTDALLEVRARLQELVADFWTDAELYRAINEGLLRFAQEEKWPYLYTVSSGIALAADQPTLELEPGVAWERHFNMLLTFSGDVRPRAPRRVHPSEGYGLRLGYSNSVGQSEPLAYYIEHTRRMHNDTVQSLSNIGDPAGNFTLTYSAQTTGNISRGATAATIEAALVALSNIAPGDVEVSGGPLGQDTVYIRFNGALSAQAISALTLAGTTTSMAIAVTQTGGASGGTFVPVVRFVPTINRAATIEYQYIRDPLLVTSSYTGLSLDIPEEYAMGICAYAAGHAFLKELNFSAKAEEQFALYQKVVQDAKREARKVTPDSGLIWGGQQPQWGWQDPAGELAYSVPPILG